MPAEYRTNSLSVVTPPASLPVSLDAARRNSRIDTTDDDTRLTELIRAATAYIEKHTDTGLITQTLSWKMDKFPACSKWLYLPSWPVQSIVSVSYTDSNNAAQTISPSTIALRNPTEGRARIARQNWEAWPAVKDTPDCVDIRFTVGFGSTEASVPDAYKQAILLLVGHWYENREAIGNVGNEIAFAVQALIETLRDADDGLGFDLE